MNRRLALKQVALFAGGIAFIPSCTLEFESVSIALNNLNIKASHENLLAEIVETIIPATDIPGAKDLNVHLFVLVMVDDCLKKQDQDVFVKSLSQFELFTERNHGKSFSKGSQIERESMLRSIEQLTESNEEAELNHQEVKKFLALTKKFTIQGFMSSQYVMTEIFPYQLIPGPYKSCIATDQVKVV